ncbi:MAG: hypothetical protein WBZ36_12835 [Candidatus Nitrosopolaris sp.]
MSCYRLVVRNIIGMMITVVAEAATETTLRNHSQNVTQVGAKSLLVSKKGTYLRQTELLLLVKVLY